MYFRARVYAQAFTLVCICVGSVYYKEDRDKRKYYTGLLAEKRAQEKRDAWIKELEARDREDTAEREKKERRKELRRAQVEQAKSEGVVEANSAISDQDLIGLAGGSRILGPAAVLWRWRQRRDQGDAD